MLVKGAKHDNFEEMRITSRAEDFSQWYLDVIRTADLAEHGPVKGTMIIKPHGYAVWEFIQKNLDERIKETGAVNAYFPLLIPKRFLKKEESHVEGFSPEVAVVTYAGGKSLNEPLIIRPTSETIMYDAFSKWIHSHKDLPLLINQWVNVVRWEMRPRLFLRSTEFLWQEGHTAHATPEEADARARMMLGVYSDFLKEILAIPVISGEKSESEKFAGAHKTYTVEGMMQDGKALQFATSHDLGDNFAKAFEIEFTDETGNSHYCSQTSWGLSTRTIGGTIMVHGDDTGLILPPKVAPIQVVITPIWVDESSEDLVNPIVEQLEGKLKTLFRVNTDYSEDRSGEKYYKWERKGVPIRLEIGPREVQSKRAVLVRRDTGKKTEVAFSKLEKTIEEELANIQDNLYQKANKFLMGRTVEVDNWEDFKEKIEQRYFILAHWCGDIEVEKKIKEETGATIRCIPFDQPEEDGICIYSGNQAKKKALFAKAY